MTQQKTSWRGLLLAFVIAPLAVSGTASADAKAIGRFKEWSVYTETVGTEFICYAATEATSKSPKRADHGAVWYYVTTWKSGKARNQPSLKVGFEFKDGSRPKAKIGKTSWTLFPAGREAFSDDTDDAAIVAALREGASLTIDGTSKRGTSVSYKFSLTGSAKAIDKAVEACR